jgi:chloride channel protein, CIC family
MSLVSLRFSPQQTVAEAESLFTARVESGGPVLDAKGNLLGVLTQVDIQRVPLSEREQRRVSEVMNRDVLIAYPDETLDEALEQLTSHRVSWMPIVDVEAATAGQHVVGILTAADIVRSYRETLMKDSRRMRGLVEGTVMIEVTVEPKMRLVDLALREAQLPNESLVVSIRRQSELLFPRGGVVIMPGDMVTFLVSPRGEEQLQRYLAERVEEMEPMATSKTLT